MTAEIPKTFHYCWFGKKPLPKLAQTCLNSWQRIHPDFELKRWDESNSDLSHPFAEAAYKAKKWAFVADFVRFQVLANQGGIYMDTDMLLLKPISEPLKNRAFLGFEDDKYVSAGIMGAVPGHPVFIELKNYYQNQEFNTATPLLINSVLNKIFVLNGLQVFNTRQTVADVEMYPSPFFYAFSFSEAQKGSSYKEYLAPESLAVHLWDHSWGDEFSEFRKGNTFKGLKKVLVKVIKNPNQPRGYYKKVVKNALKNIN